MRNDPTAESIPVSNTFRNRDTDVHTGCIRDIYVKNIVSRSESSVFIKSGGELCPIENIRIDGCEFTLVRQGTQKTGLFDESPAFGGSKWTNGQDFIFPDEIYPHSIPAFYAHGVRDLSISDCSVRFIKPEQEAWAEVAQLESCTRARISRVRGKAARPDLPAYTVLESRDVVLDAPDTDGTLLLNAEAENVTVRSSQN